MKIKFKTFIAPLVVLMGMLNLLWAVEPAWTKYWNGAGNGVDAPSVMVKDNAGNIYVAGFTDGTGSGISGYDLVVVSYTPDGVKRWEYTYDGPANSVDGAWSMILGNDGYLYVTGISTGSGTDLDVVTLSLALNGSVRWIKRWNNPNANSKDNGWCITQDDDHNIYVGGNTKSSSGDYNLLILSYTSNGTLRWYRIYGGAGGSHDKSYSIVYGEDGYVYAAGYSVENGSYPDILVIKYSTSGNYAGKFTYDASGLDDMAYTIVLGEDGYLYVTGRTETNGSMWDYAVLKISRGLNLVSQYSYAGSSWDAAISLVYGNDGNIYTCGYTNGNIFTVISLDEQLNERWIYTYNPSNNEWGEASNIEYGADDNLYVVGANRITGEQYNKFIFISTDTHGNERFLYRGGSLIYTQNPKDYVDVVFGNDADVYVTAGIDNSRWSSDGLEFDDILWELNGHTTQFPSSNPNNSSDIFIARFDVPEVSLIWPNSQGIVVEEGKTYWVRYDGASSAGIQNVKAYFSPDAGQTWTNFIGEKSYEPPPYPTEVFDDSIQWNVAQQPTLKGRVKVVLTDANNQTDEDISDYDFALKPARPTNLSATSSYPYTSVDLSWVNNSAYASGYEIHKKVMDDTWKFLADISTTSYTDNSVSRYYDYWYKVNTYTNTQNGKIYSYFTQEKWVTTSPFLAVDNVSLAKSGGKSLIKIGTRLHAVYSQSGKIYYRYSDDNGLTWSSPEYIGDGVTPVICADNDDRLWVEWARILYGSHFARFIMRGRQTPGRYIRFQMLVADSIL